MNHYRKKAISHCHRPITHSTGSGAFHENPDSRNDCAGQGRRYPDNGHATWSKTEFHCSSCAYTQRCTERKGTSLPISRSSMWFIYTRNFTSPSFKITSFVVIESNELISVAYLYSDEKFKCTYKIHIYLIII